MNRLCTFATLLSPIFALAQGLSPRYDLPPALVPASCTFALASVATLAGPPAYKRLAIELKALESAQEGVAALAQGRDDLLKNLSSPSIGMASLFTHTEQAHDALLCSASLIAKYQPVDSDDENAKTLLIVAYNQEAAAISDLEAHTKERFLRTEKDQSPATNVHDAERMTAISRLQNEAASTLSEVTAFSLLLSVEDDNSKAKDTKQTLLPCVQFNDLKTRSATLARQTKSAYTDVASLFITFLNGHKCK